EALALALDQARARAGAERLAGVEGVVGTLLDLLEVDPGWEAAVEAALGEALTAVVVEGVESGRRALRVLAEGDVPGAVLALGVAPAPRSAPPVGEPVLAHVRARRPEVDALLAGLLGPAVAVEGGWPEAVDAVLAHPDAVVVTRAGGRFSAGGWRASTTTTGATGAALDEARARAAEAATRADEAVEAHRAARAALDRARKDEAAAVQALDAHQRTLAAATAARERAARDREEVLAELDLLAEQRAAAAERLARDRERAEALAAELPELEAEEAARRERAPVTAGWAESEKRAYLVAARDTDLRRRRPGVEQPLTGTAAARRRAGARRGELEAAERALDRVAALVRDRLAVLERPHAAMTERRR